MKFTSSTDFDLDLGNAHYLQWQIHEGKRAGALIEHPAGGKDHQAVGEYCAAGLSWVPGFRLSNPWTIEGEPDEHLTISPSVLCSCGDHGYIRDGKWVPA